MGRKVSDIAFSARRWQSSLVQNRPDMTGSELKVHSDWYENDERYVRRGELLAAMNWLASWNDELEEMNVNKRGGRIAFLAR